MDSKRTQRIAERKFDKQQGQAPLMALHEAGLAQGVLDYVSKMAAYLAQEIDNADSVESLWQIKGGRAALARLASDIRQAPKPEPHM